VFRSSTLRIELNDAHPPAIEVCGVTKRLARSRHSITFRSASSPANSSFCSDPQAAARPHCCVILAGLETPDTGTIRFKGQDVAKLPPHERGAPMVFQNYALWPHLNVRDNVAFGLVERRAPKGESVSA